MSRTGILIVTHNSAGHIGACLDALNTVRATGDVVLVIDNASTDHTAHAVAGKQDIRFVQNKANAGFAGAVNQGFRLLLDDQVDDVLLLNPDVILRSPLHDLKAACRRSGLACGRLTGIDGKTQIGFSFRRFPTPFTLLFETVGVNRMWPSNPVNRRYRCLDVDHDVAGEVEQPAGAMLMVRKDVWTLVGGFDEDFHPVWFEDVDFCRRAATAGFRAAYIPTLEGTHAGGHSVLQIPNQSRRRYWYASLLRYSRKHFGRAGRGLVAVGIGGAAMVRSVGALSQEESAGAAKLGSRVLNEGIPSTKNTERMLKRLHAR
ncbi:MAG TPA: glycosyltransferase family 2 protein [Bryobacteraceae bacterium]